MSLPVTTALPSRQGISFALCGGILHLSIAGILWLWFGFTARVDLFLAYISIGAVSLGAIPALLLVTKRLITPSLIVATALTVSAYGTWSVYIAPPVSSTPIDPTPFGRYLIRWVIVVTVAFLAGGGEYEFRNSRKNNNEQEPTRIHR